MFTFTFRFTAYVSHLYFHSPFLVRVNHFYVTLALYVYVFDDIYSLRFTLRFTFAVYSSNGVLDCGLCHEGCNYTGVPVVSSGGRDSSPERSAYGSKRVPTSPLIMAAVIGAGPDGGGSKEFGRIPRAALYAPNNIGF